MSGLRRHHSRQPSTGRVQSMRSLDPTTRAAASTTAARVEALVNDLQRAFNGTAPASNAAPATEPTDLERQLAAALDEGRALLTYLGA